jgi:hypothetical protein
MFSRILEINFSTNCKHEFIDFRIKIRELAQITPAAHISGTQKSGFCFFVVNVYSYLVLILMKNSDLLISDPSAPVPSFNYFPVK